MQMSLHLISYRIFRKHSKMQNMAQKTIHYGLRLKHSENLHFMQMSSSLVSYSFMTGCALNILNRAASCSILCLSSISLCISSSCLTKLSNWNGSGWVHCFGSGFGGICIIRISHYWSLLPLCKMGVAIAPLKFVIATHINIRMLLYIFPYMNKQSP